MFTERRWEAAAGELDEVQALLGLRPPAAVLDLCCGPGRHALELARRGFMVTGVDRTERYVRDASARAREEKCDAEFVLADMREFQRPEAYDAVIDMFTAFGYFEDPADDRRVVDNVYRSLEAGGRFILEMVRKEVLAGIFQERGWYEVADGTLVLEARKVESGWSWMWMDNRWIIITGRERHEFRVGHRLYSAAELTALLEDTGAKRLVVVGKK